MAKHTVYYLSYSSSKAATAYSRDSAVTGTYVGGICIMLCIGALIWYGYGTVDLFSGTDYYDYINYIASLVSLWIMSRWFLYFFRIRDSAVDRHCKIIIIRENPRNLPEELVKELEEEIKKEGEEEKKKEKKAFNNLFYPLLIIGTAIIGGIYSIYEFYHNRSGLVEIIIASVILIVGIVTLIICVRPPREEKKIMHENNISSEDSFFFCRKCGAKILSDSVFCSCCGNEIIK